MIKAAESNKERKFYVYALLDPRKPGEYRYEGLDFTFDFEPFYIGKGHGNRVKTHYTSHRKGSTNKRKNNKLDKLERLGYSPCYTIVMYTDIEQEAFGFEIDAIASIGWGREGLLTNLTGGGEGGVGMVITEEHRQKISKANTGKYPSEEAKQRMSEAQRRRSPTTPEVCRKISQAKKGVPKTEEAKKSIALLRKPVSEETRLKQSIAQKNRPAVTEEARINMSKANKNRPPITDETRAKISAGLRKRVISEEARINMAAAALRKPKVSDATKSKMSSTQKISQVKQKFVVETPEGELLSVFRINALCKKYKLFDSALRQTIPGHKKYKKDHKGFKLIEIIPLPTNWKDIPGIMSEFLELEELYCEETYAA